MNFQTNWHDLAATAPVQLSRDDCKDHTTKAACAADQHCHWNATKRTCNVHSVRLDADAAVSKRLYDGQPLVEVARKMKAIEGMLPQINDFERRLGIMQSVEPILESAIKALQRVVDVRGMEKKMGKK